MPADVAADSRAAQLLSRRVREERASAGRQLVEIARGIPDVVALARGDPDLPTPAHVIAAAKAAMDAGHTRYTPLRGLDALREAIAEKLERENSIKVDPEGGVLITTGTQEAVAALALTLLDPGDEILLPDPYYGSYVQAVQYAGGRVVTVPTRAAERFQPDASEIARRITSRTKALVLLTPHNPTGVMYSRATLERLADLAISENLLIVSDELYEKLVFEPVEHVSIASLPGMRDRVITINGFSKNYRMTGWRIGYMVGPAAFIRAALEIKYTLTICAPTIAQHAALAALRGPQECLDEAVAVYRERRDAVMRKLDEIGLSYVRPDGAFYVFADISALGMTSEEFCLRLLREAHVLVSPGSNYGALGEGAIRISLLAPLPHLLEGMRRMEQFVAACARRGPGG